MAITDIDKAKIRTAVKCYLLFNKEATARQLNDFLMQNDFRLRRDISTNELARDLTYCCKHNNFLNLKSVRNTDNTQVYSLRR